jgi:hypothetical protein
MTTRRVSASAARAAIGVAAIAGAQVVGTQPVVAGPRAGPTDWGAYANYISKKANVACGNPAGNSAGGPVVGWQAILWTANNLTSTSQIDGDFGATTDTATKNWQKGHGLNTDGCVGTQTWRTAEGGNHLAWQYSYDDCPPGTPCAHWEEYKYSSPEGPNGERYVVMDNHPYCNDWLIQSPRNTSAWYWMIPAPGIGCETY